jgi:hypothetical protein
MKEFMLDIEANIAISEAACNATGYVKYINFPMYTVAILGFHFHGLAEARVDFATYDSEGKELPTHKQSNVFSVKDVMSIMAGCKDMSKDLIALHNPERIAYEGAEAKRFHMYERMAKRIGEGFRIWTAPKDLTVWLELYSEWE